MFATHDDLAARLGLTFTSAENIRADALLAIASGLIQEAVKPTQQIALVADDSLTMPCVYEDHFQLPQRPVVSVASVAVDGTTVDASCWYVDGDQVVLQRAFFDGTSQIFFPWARTNGNGAVSWGGPRHTVTVVYTHGFAAIPSTVKNICLEAVVRAWVNPGSIARETVGDVSTVYDNARFSPQGMALTDGEVEQIRDIIGWQARSVQLR